MPITYNTCHISLEMSEAVVAKRYFQSFYAASRRQVETFKTTFELNADGQFEQLGTVLYTPKYSFDQEDTMKVLEAKHQRYQTRLNRLVIKAFETGMLTVSALTAYLDLLERTANFIPDLLLLDYIDLMKLSSTNYRLDLGGLYKEIRGLAVQRNIAVATVSQANRLGVKAKVVTEEFIAEDYSKIPTADTVFSYSQTTR